MFADHRSNYFKSKVTNENRESTSKDTAVRMNSMQTNLAFMDELIKNEPDEIMKATLLAQNKKHLDMYMKFANDNLG